MRPLLFITFPQGFRLPEVGAKRRLNGTLKVNTQTVRRTDRQTDRQSDISTHRKHRPRGPMLWQKLSWRCSILKLVWDSDLGTSHGPIFWLLRRKKSLIPIPEQKNQSLQPLWGCCAPPRFWQEIRSIKVKRASAFGILLLYLVWALIVGPYAKRSKLSYTTTLSYTTNTILPGLG